MNLKKITRLEVIDNAGRAYVGYNKEIEFSLQDDGRTLKILVKPRAVPTYPPQGGILPAGFVEGLLEHFDKNKPKKTKKR